MREQGSREVLVQCDVCGCWFRSRGGLAVLRCLPERERLPLLLNHLLHLRHCTAPFCFFTGLSQAYPSPHHTLLPGLHSVTALRYTSVAQEPVSVIPSNWEGHETKYLVVVSKDKVCVCM